MGGTDNNNSSTSSASEQSEAPPHESQEQQMDARIEDGKLFYEKRWLVLHRVVCILCGMKKSTDT
jgi:hypothetical protein